MRYLILLATALTSFTCALEAQLAQPPAGVTEGLLKELTNACPANPDLGDLNASPFGRAGEERVTPAFKPKPRPVSLRPTYPS